MQSKPELYSQSNAASNTQHTQSHDIERIMWYVISILRFKASFTIFHVALQPEVIHFSIGSDAA